MKGQAVFVTCYVLIPEEEYKCLLPSPSMERNVPTHSDDGDDEDSANNDKKKLNRILETQNMPDDVKQELYFNEKQKIWAINRNFPNPVQEKKFLFQSMI